MQISSLIRSARLALLGSAALAIGSSVAFAEAPVRSTVVSYANGGGDQNGYSRASVGLNYKFIRCDNEIHLAYSLDNKSVRVSDTYSYNGKEVMAAGIAPTPPTIALSGKVTEGGSTTTIAQISDGLAAPALGYGCFSGQTKRVGPVPAGSPADVDVYLSSLILIPSDMPQYLRNGAVENAQAMAERAEQQSLAAEKEKAEQAMAKRAEQARVQAAKVQSAKEAKALADTKQADEAARLAVAEDSELPQRNQGDSQTRIVGSAERLTNARATADEPTSSQSTKNEVGDYLFCLNAKAYTPIYRLSGLSGLNDWAARNNKTDARKWFIQIHHDLVSDKRIGHKPSDLTTCFIGERLEAKDLKSSSVNQNAILIPWSLAPDWPSSMIPSAQTYKLVPVD